MEIKFHSPLLLQQYRFLSANLTHTGTDQNILTDRHQFRLPSSLPLLQLYYSFSGSHNVWCNIHVDFVARFVCMCPNILNEVIKKCKVVPMLN
jgi:hypothetical protein